LSARNDLLSVPNDSLCVRNELLRAHNDPLSARNDSFCVHNGSLSACNNPLCVRNDALSAVGRTERTDWPTQRHCGRDRGRLNRKAKHQHPRWRVLAGLFYFLKKP